VGGGLRWDYRWDYGWDYGRERVFFSDADYELYRDTGQVVRYLNRTYRLLPIRRDDNCLQRIRKSAKLVP
jgi:hypothetical protein